MPLLGRDGALVALVDARELAAFAGNSALTRFCRRQASSSPGWPRLAARTALAKRHFDAVPGVCRNGGCRYRGDLYRRAAPPVAPTTWALSPILYILTPIAPIAWVPTSIVIFGISNVTAIFIVFMGAYFIRIIATAREHPRGRSRPTLRHAVAKHSSAAWRIVRAQIEIALGGAEFR